VVLVQLFHQYQHLLVLLAQQILVMVATVLEVQQLVVLEVLVL
jgi:hypothetical protein